MKKILLSLFILVLTVATLFAQAPQKMSYQAVVRNANNTLVTNQNVSAKISILQGSVNGTPVYVETHNAATNVNGLLTLEIGGGNVVTGSMSTIDWGNGPFFLKSEIDPDGGVNYSVEGVQQFLSVPYALYAEHSGNVPSFGIVPTDSGYVVSITQPGGTPQTFFIQNGTPGPAGPAGPVGPIGPAGDDGNDGIGIDSISGPVSNDLVDTYTIHYSNGTTTTFTVTNGADGQGIAQTLTIAGNQLSISGGNTVTIPTGGDGTGIPGADGVGIDSIAKTGTNANVDTYTIYYSNNTTYTYTVTNGVDGAPGEPGAPGAPGEPGTPAPIPVFTYSMNADSTVLIITVTVGDNTQSWQIPVGAGGSGGTQMNASWSVTDPTSPAYIIDKPTNVSAFTNDAGYITMDSIPAIPTVPTNVSAFTNDAGYITMDSIPAIPTVPSNVGAFTNDAGYITSAEVPTLNVTQTDTGYVLTVTQPGGTAQTYILRNGVDGAPGAPGTPGDPGAPGTPAPIPVFTHSMNADSTVLTITVTVGDNTQSWQIPVGAGGSGGTQMNASWSVTDPTSPAYIIDKPTNVSAFTNDAGYITRDSIPAIPTVPTNVGAFTNDAGYITRDSIPAIPTVPTNVSAFTNDAGYITMDSIPAIPTVPTNVGAFTNDAGYITMDSIPAIPTVPTNVSAFTNDAGYITMDSIPSIPTVPTNVSAFTNDAGYITMDSIPTIPTVPTNVSAFTNDAGYLTMDSITDAQVNADWNATSGVAEILNKPDIAGMQNAMDSLADEIDNLHESMGFICGKDKVKDIEGNEYNTVRIGQQCWMKENMRTTKYPNGTEIPLGTDSSSTLGTRSVPGSEANVAARGYLYNWVATMNGASATSANPSGVQGICPDGWHVPSAEEYIQLINYLKSQNEFSCGNSINNIAKALASSLYWSSSTNDCSIGKNSSANNATGFSAVPTGMWASNYYGHIGEWYYGNQNTTTYLWTTEENATNPSNVYVFSLANNVALPNITSLQNRFVYANSVRCLQNPETSALQDIINQSLAPLQNAISNMMSDADFVCGQSTVKDYDGNEYATVNIGNQCWMKENLKTTHYSDGTSIPKGTDSSLSKGYYYEAINYLNSNYGFYYNWPAIMRNSASSNTNPSGVQGVCPVGWHVPSSAEYTELINFVKSNSDYVCGSNPNNIAKALADSLYWSSSSNECAVGNNFSSNNTTGFSAKGAGMWLTNFSGHIGQMYFGQTGMSARFWTSEEVSSTSANHFLLYNSTSSPSFYSSYGKESAMNVRCVKDPTLSSNSIQNAIDNFAQDLNSNTFICGVSTVKDYDGNEYRTVKIGNQCWTKENLKSTHFTNGTAIALGNDTSSTVAYRYNPGNNANNVSTYGYLYNWAALVNGETGNHIQGICPVGWHVPQSTDLQELVSYVKSQSEFICGDTNINISKSLAGTTGWDASANPCSPGYNSSTNNASGFSLLPAGNIPANSNQIVNMCSIATLWSLSSTGAPYRWPYSMGSSGTMFSGGGGLQEIVYKRTANQVRCLRDATDESPISSMMIDMVTPLEDKINELENRIDELQNLLNSQLFLINQLMSTTFTCGSKILDADGNLYNTVQIGSQCWMKENLRTTKYPDGTQIPLLTDSSSTIGARYIPNASGATVQDYGYLYNLTAVMNGSSPSSANPSGVQGICPTGWHVPSRAEFVQLQDYVKGVPAYVCGSGENNINKALADSINWLTTSSPNDCAVNNVLENNNATGFTARPAGHWSLNNSGYVGIMHWSWFRAAAEFWTCEQIPSSTSHYYFYLYYTSATPSITGGNKVHAYSVRCLKD